MMTIVWILLWLAITGVVISFLGWSANVAIMQKRAWSEFAEKYKLAVNPMGKGMLAPVFVTGAIKGRTVNIYAQSEQSESERTRRVYTHVEVFVNEPPPAQAVLSKRVLPESLQALSFPQTVAPPTKDWPSLSVAQTNDTYALANWLTPQRMRALKDFMDSAGRLDEPMFICDGEQAFLVWRTQDPLRDPRNLNALVQKLFGFAREMDTPETGSTAKPKGSSETSDSDTSA